jgi:NTP pyrophosphatase (non-canonical NTP hydrolase)
MPDEYDSFSKYQAATEATAIYPGQGGDMGLIYCALGLAGEAGEYANKIKKALLRGDDGANVTAILTDELGDTLWYIARSCAELGISLADVAELNLDKLRKRSDAGTLRGSGDDR